MDLFHRLSFPTIFKVRILKLRIQLFQLRLSPSKAEKFKIKNSQAGQNLVFRDRFKFIRKQDLILNLVETYEW